VTPGDLRAPRTVEEVGARLLISSRVRGRRGSGLDRHVETASRRCAWASSGDRLMQEYHDREWGVPVHEDRRHFEFLVLEGAQAGLSWSVVLRKRPGYARAFSRFDPEKVARFPRTRIERLLLDPSIVRNRRKIEATVANARAFRTVQREFGSFDRYSWRFVGGEPRQNRWRTPGQVPATSRESDAFSDDLRRRGFRFVGSTVIYAHMQAVGMVNDHLASCFRHAQVQELASGVRPSRAGRRPDAVR
jgi:DNA-3-methyladenine glycosylase I